MTRFAVSVVRPPGHLHNHAFDETAEALHHALADLGHDSVLTGETELPGRIHFVLGANLFRVAGTAPAADSILYNLEQIWPGSPWLADGSLLELYRRHPVVDYSPENIRQLALLGVDRVGHLPIGFHPCLQRIPRAEEDIDVLFVGFMNGRRERVLAGLIERGLRVQAVSALYGRERDALIARAKVVLNVHFYEHHVLEDVRLNFLLANERCVVSESGTPDEEARFAPGVVFARYEDLVERCVAVLHDPAGRSQVARAGFERVRARPLQAELERMMRTWPRWPQ